MKNIEKLKKYSPLVLRVGISIVFLWFGLNGIFNPYSLMSWIPPEASILPFAPKTLVLLNGIFEVIFGSLLLLGLFTRITALLLALHLSIITMSIGFNEVGVRDFGLTLATFSIFLSGTDKWCLDNKLRKK